MDDKTVIVVLKDNLTPSENENGVAYLLRSTVEEGTLLDFPHTRLVAPWKSRVVFIDSQPLANYGHPCRYLLINDDSQVRSVEARYPPFRPENRDNWCVVYAAPRVPTNVLNASKWDGLESEGSFQ